MGEYIRKYLKKELVENKSTIFLNRTHDSSNGAKECSYCNGKRETFNGLEEGNLNYKSGFSSTKMRVDDYESLLNAGYSRSGSYFYVRNYMKTCCEPYSYRVDFDQFKPSESQRKAVKRFNKYINFGAIKGISKEGKPLKQEAII